jgi:4'-phosphopantetheinyl transferase
VSEKREFGELPSQPIVDSDKTRLNNSSIQMGHDRPVQGIDSTREVSEVASWKFVAPVTIWFRVTRSMSAQAIDQARSMLSLDERARSDRFVFERDRRDFVAAHALLRGMLSHYGQLPPDGWKFASEASGKPFLIDQSELQFNIAHTRGLVACALSLAGPIGIDVESTDSERDIDAISEKHFALTEVTQLRACEEVAHRQMRFTELWTLKEAYLKALGAGLLRSLDEIAFHFSGASDLQATTQGNSIHVDWKFGLFAPLDNYRLAVAVRTNTKVQFFAREWPEKHDQPSLTPIRSSALVP